MAGPDLRLVPPDPDAVQRLASDPAASVWVSASAGTGKTKVLTDRVLALLITGTRPERILCLTYTRAAAAEMAIRVGDALGAMARADDDGLDARIRALTDLVPDDALRAHARRLFGRVLDCPGGLKIQTIHAFCESLLRRFPVEAGLAPHFRVLDDVERRNMLAAAREEVLARAVGAADGTDAGDDAELEAAIGVVAGRAGADKFTQLLERLTADRNRIRRVLDHHGGLAPARAAIRAARGLGAGDTEARVIAAACDDDAFDGAALRAVLRVLQSGSARDRERAAFIAPWLASADRRTALWTEYLRGYISVSSGERYKDFITGGTLKKLDPADADAHLAAMAAECDRLEATAEICRRVRTAEGSCAVLTIGAALIDAYERRKHAAQRLDYDDLIAAARHLLRDSAATAWVLYKLDGGIDHLLVDEAQDTSPDQWEVVSALTEEFFAGLGAQTSSGAGARTVFAVGDAKQSIYSFQGADPAAFADMRAHFAARAAGAGTALRDVGLHHSFRSTRPVLASVDRVFAGAVAREGVAAAGEKIGHDTQREGQAGHVELWPVMEGVKAGASDAWAPGPPDGGAGEAMGVSAEARLAHFLAAQIRDWIGTMELPSRGRRLEPRDVMVLVRRRTQFVDLLVRALKRVEVEVAGVDRMKLAGELAVKDMLAVGRFLLLPGDDYTLACVLKGPFIGLADDDLLELAPKRKGTLWAALDARVKESRAWRAARDRLAALLARTDFDRPFELFTSLLDEGDGRARLIARLGAEAEDPVNEFLELALAYERAGTPSLQGFLAWFDGGQSEIKRDLEAAERNEVRIMTVHGAKGLQAPVVILPDTLAMPLPPDGPFWQDVDGVGLPVWAARAADFDREARALRERRVADGLREHHRLLYVAMTRAEDALFVTGWKGMRSPGDGCWYRLIADGLDEIAEKTVFDFTGIVQDFAGEGFRYRLPQDKAPDKAKDAGRALRPKVALEGWENAPAPAGAGAPVPLTPSDAGDADEPVLSPLAAGEVNPFLKGRLVHGLLELLPGLPAEARRAGAARYLARPQLGLDAPACAAIADETLAILDHARFSPLFGPDSLAEVPVTGIVDGHVVSGQIDRLVVGAREVLCVDYKTSRPVPSDAAGVAPAHVRQMALYRAVLERVFPDRMVRCALLYTAAPVMVELEQGQLDAILAAVK